MINLLARLIDIFCLVVIVVCLWKTGEFFNTLPESNKYKAVMAWDLLLLLLFLITIISRIISM